MTGDLITPSQPKRRVLVVEDNEAAAFGLSQLLRNEGFEVTSVRDGAAALEVFASGIHHDFLLLDLRLPDLDGRELALKARQLKPWPHVVLMTGWDLDPVLDNPADWGIDRVISKPIDINVLLNVLNGK